MSRRTLANAERRIIEVQNSKSSAPTRIAVRVPSAPRMPYLASSSYYYAAAGDDPNKPGSRLIQCKSVRLSRARRQVKFMHGVRLYRAVEGSYQLV